MDAIQQTELTLTLQQLAAAADTLQQAATRLAERETREASFTIEAEADRIHDHIQDLTTRLEAAEATIAELRASATTGRKTHPAATASLLAKQGVTGDSIASLEAGAIDAALVSLSMEQRIAVKAQLLRSGLLG